jgi:hypothetical protein
MAVLDPFATQQTPKYKLPYPQPSDPVAQGAANFQSLATAVEAALDTPLVTILPTANRFEGQRVILVDNASAPTFAWLLRWSVAGNAWNFLGGNPKKLSSQFTVPADSNGFPGAGLGLNVPCAGYYDVVFSGHGTSNTSNNGLRCVWGTSPPFAEIYFGAFSGMTRTARTDFLNATDPVYMFGYQVGATAQSYWCEISVTPQLVV